jgi:RNA polymerase sigma-70 factor (ECF subfamily)
MDINPVIFAAAQAGDPKALEQLLAIAHPDIRRYARRQCHASSALEDVVQEALIVLYRRVRIVRSPAALAAWLITVVTRLCMLPVLGLMRGIEQLKSVDDSMQFAYMPTDELRLDVVRAIESLPPTHREVILLRDLQEMTISEIAQSLHITREATKSRLHRARSLLREFLSGQCQ